LGQWVTGAGPKFKNGLKGSEPIDPMDTMSQPTHHINIFFKKILVFFFFKNMIGITCKICLCLKVQLGISYFGSENW
jgi:hypothetical protein